MYNVPMDKLKDTPCPASYISHLKTLKKHWEYQVEVAKKHDVEGVDKPAGVVYGLDLAVKELTKT